MSGFVFYDGPSMLDGQPIIGIAVTTKSQNGKIGNLVQTYILRADAHPVDAIRTGDDVSICGDCPHRRNPATGARTCYVNVGQSVAAVYGAWARGSYPLIDPRDAALQLAGRIVRLGSYGDPAAIPVKHWRDLLTHAAGRTGYTHQWRNRPEFRDLIMASADSALDRDVARSIGWRTFRVRTADEALAAREIVCPASPEGNNRRTCETCQACDGAAGNAARASIAIIVHGASARRFIPVAAV
jgi:hypothetical protein